MSHFYVPVFYSSIECMAIQQLPTSPEALILESTEGWRRRERPPSLKSLRNRALGDGCVDTKSPFCVSALQMLAKLATDRSTPSPHMAERSGAKEAVPRIQLGKLHLNPYIQQLRHKVL